MLAKAFSHDVVERRAARHELTGEHLVFAKTAQRNVYLYAAFHGEDATWIADCARVAVEDFPDLKGCAAVFA
jgi:hypothetical protein